jgi:hypothetical protein
MAPNRKQLHNLELPTDSLGLDGLRSTVQSKFLPLTDPRSQTQLENLVSESQTEQQQQPSDYQSYWDWQTEDGIVDLLEKDLKKKSAAEAPVVVVDLFSASHIEANLIADSKKYSSSSVVDEPEHDDNNKIHHATIIRPQHASSESSSSYWDWSVNTSEYEEELANRLTSSTHIFQNLVKTRHQRQPVQPANDQYWTWETSADEVKKEEDDVDELALQQNYWTWRTTNVPTTLDGDDDVTIQQRNKAMAESDSYWEWTTPSEYNTLCDQPWVDSMKTVHAVVSSGKSYWDW